MERIKRCGFYVDEDNPLAQDFTLQVRKKLEAESVKISLDIKTAPKLLIVFGGDGTMLKAAHAHDFKPTFLGINCGHKGYLMNDGFALEVAERILGRRFETHSFPLLEIEAENEWEGFAINDVYFNRISGQTCKVNVKIDGVEVAERISGDGIVICTALGSTGYFVPAGGSAIHPKLPVIGFAPVVRNIPIQILPMIFSFRSELEVTLLSPPEEVKGWYDGIELPYFKKIRVKKGNRKIKLAFWKEENFTKRLVEKIMKV